MSYWANSKTETDDRVLTQLCGPRDLHDEWLETEPEWSPDITYCLWTTYTTRAMIWHRLLKGATPLFVKNRAPAYIDFIMGEAVGGTYNHTLYEVKSVVRNQVDYTTIEHICEKDKLAAVIEEFMPRSWPATEITEVTPGQVFIVKPVGRGAMSNAGVSVVSTTDGLLRAKAQIAVVSKWRAIVCEYITTPATYLGFKFHLRAHILVRSWGPAVWFNLYGMYLAARKYTKNNWEDPTIHTTHFTGNDIHPIFPIDTQNAEWQKILDDFMPQLCAKMPQPKPYPESAYAYEILAPDLLIANGRVYVLEINNKPGRKGADTPAQREFDRAITEWEYKHGPAEALKLSRV